MLHEFLEEHRGEILARARLRVAARNAPRATDVELTTGLPLFLDQLREALRRSSSHEVLDHAEIEESAGRHGRTLFEHGVTVAQVVHDYGDLCQVITGLAVDHHTVLDADEFRTLNLCLDDAIAGAVTEYSSLRERTIADAGTERLGYLAHELRNVANTSILTFGSIQKGTVSPAGSTGVLHARSLQRLISLIDRSLADVRLESDVQNVERVAVREVLEEVEVGATMVARERGLHLEVMAVDSSAIVEADRQILAAAVANLVQNALKFTQPDTTVRVGASTTTDRVLISVEDECGGLPPGKVDHLLKPFTQRGHDRSGLGLGLAICRKAAKAMGGELHIRDLPGKGCIFAIDLPRQSPPPKSIFDRPRKTKGGSPEGGSGAAHREASSSVRSSEYDDADRALVGRSSAALGEGAMTSGTGPRASRAVTVLFVDDDADTRSGYRLVATEAGMHVELARDGHEAIALASALPPDVIVLDLGLRSTDGLDGFEVARRLRADERTSSIPIIIVSGSSSVDDMAAMRGSGCAGHLLKPCAADDLVGLVTSVARSRRDQATSNGEAARATSPCEAPGRGAA